MSRYYGLDDRPTTQEDGLTLYSDARNAERQVGRTQVGDASVSTVHLVIDHSFGQGPPLIYETMIFGGEHDEFQTRYSTRSEAEAGHAAIVKALEEGREPSA